MPEVVVQWWWQWYDPERYTLTRHITDVSVRASSTQHKIMGLGIRERFVEQHKKTKEKLDKLEYIKLRTSVHRENCLHTACGNFHAITIELSSCNRDCMAQKPKVFIIWLFTEKVCLTPRLSSPVQCNHPGKELKREFPGRLEGGNCLAARNILKPRIIF